MMRNKYSFVLEQYVQGRISLSKALELLGMNVYDILPSIVQRIDIEQEIDEIYKNAVVRDLEDYLALPKTNRRHEIIDGKIVMYPSSTAEHQLILGNVVCLLDKYIEENKLGDIFLSPLDIKIPSAKFRTRQPDLFFISKERSGFTGRKSVEGIELLDIAPELVIEVLSQNDTQKQINEKLTDYRKIGVLECWLVNPDSETVKVLKLFRDKIKTIGIFCIGDKVRSEVLPELNLSVEEVFV